MPANKNVTVGEIIDEQNRQNPKKPVKVASTPEVRIIVGRVVSPRYILDASIAEIERGLNCVRSVR
jgi:hypothetical protein